MAAFQKLRSENPNNRKRKKPPTKKPSEVKKAMKNLESKIRKMTSQQKFKKLEKLVNRAFASPPIEEVNKQFPKSTVKKWGISEYKQAEREYDQSTFTHSQNNIFLTSSAAAASGAGNPPKELYLQGIPINGGKKYTAADNISIGLFMKFLSPEIVNEIFSEQKHNGTLEYMTIQGKGKRPGENRRLDIQSRTKTQITFSFQHDNDTCLTFMRDSNKTLNIDADYYTPILKKLLFRALLVTNNALETKAPTFRYLLCFR